MSILFLITFNILKGSKSCSIHVCIYQDLHLVEAGQLPHVPEGLEQILEEGGGHSDQVLVHLVLFLVDAEQRNHSVGVAVALQQLQIWRT